MFIPVYKNHYLGCTVISSAIDISVLVRARLKLASGEIIPVEQSIPISVAYVPVVVWIPLSIGELISCVVSTDNRGVTRGQVFARVVLSDGRGDLAAYDQVLVQDYVTTSDYLSYPGGRIRSSEEGVGFRYQIILPNPALGNRLIYNCGVNRKQHVQAGSTILVTNAVVIARTVFCEGDFGPAMTTCNGSNTNQNAGLTVSYRWQRGNGSNIATNEMDLCFSDSFILYPGMALVFDAVNLNAGDQFGGSQIWVEEHLLL